MKIVIDGYNILKQIYVASYIQETDRYRFIQQLCAYAQNKQHNIMVLFDGGPSSWPTKEKASKRVSVIYVGAHATADEYIKDIIEDNPGANLLLVTDDVELTKYAQMHDIVSIQVKIFYACMQEALDQQSQHVVMSTTVTAGPVTKLSDTSSAQVDQLMESLATVTYTKQEDYSIRESKQERASKQSKQERRLLSILKKL